MSEIEILKDRDEKAKAELVKVIGEVIDYAEENDLKTFAIPILSLKAVHSELVRLRALEVDLLSRKEIYVASYNFGFGEGNGPPTWAFWNVSDAFKARKESMRGSVMTDMEIYSVPVWPQPESESITHQPEVKEPPGAA